MQLGARVGRPSFEVDSAASAEMDEGGKPRDLYPNCDMSIWLRTCEKEVTEPVPGKVSKEIPLWLEGSLLRNGPGSLRVGNSEFRHVFDGSALLHKFCISKGTVTYQNCFLKSDTYKKNQAAQRIVVTEFGTRSVPDPCLSIFQKIAAIFDRFHNQSDNAMVSIYPFGDEYFTMSEVPIVHRIDVSNLSTKDRINISDRLGIVSHTSHPHVINDGTVYNLGMIPSKTGPKYCILKFPANTAMFETGRIVSSVPSRWRFHPSYMHSFGITEKYFVIVEQPLSVSLWDVFLNCLLNRPLSKALKWYQEETTVFYVIERSSGKIYRRYNAQAFFYLHIINQYEEDDHLVIDICCYKDASMIECMYIDSLKEGQQNPDYAKMFRGRPLRFVMPLNPLTTEGHESSNLNRLLNTKSKAFRKNGEIWIEPELLCDFGCETPRIHYEKFSGKKYTYFYAISSDVDSDNPGTLIKVDVKEKSQKTWCEENVYPSEPIFVARPDCQAEDDGLILSALIWGREKTDQVGLLVLDARTWKEVGRAVFKTHGPVPKCLHGWFTKTL